MLTHRILCARQQERKPRAATSNLIWPHWCCLALQVVFYLIDLLHEGNPAVVQAADGALDIIIGTDEEWASKLRALKFEAHNEAWLEACAKGSTTQQVI